MEGVNRVAGSAATVSRALVFFGRRGGRCRAEAKRSEPLTGCGVQQTRGQAHEANRQGGEKPRRRNMSGGWYRRAVGSLLPRVGVCRVRRWRGGLTNPMRGDAGESRCQPCNEHSEEEAKSTRVGGSRLRSGGDADPGKTSKAPVGDGRRSRREREIPSDPLPDRQ